MRQSTRWSVLSDRQILISVIGDRHQKPDRCISTLYQCILYIFCKPSLIRDTYAEVQLFVCRKKTRVTGSCRPTDCSIHPTHYHTNHRQCVCVCVCTMLFAVIEVCPCRGRKWTSTPQPQEMWFHKCMQPSHTWAEDHEYDTWVHRDRWSFSDSNIWLNNQFKLLYVLYGGPYTLFVVRMHHFKDFLPCREYIYTIISPFNWL